VVSISIDGQIRTISKSDDEIYIRENIADHVSYQTSYYANSTVKVHGDIPDKSKTGTLYVSYPDLPENYSGPNPVPIYNVPYPPRTVHRISKRN
jgi:hypothetical protein